MRPGTPRVFARGVLFWCALLSLKADSAPRFVLVIATASAVQRVAGSNPAHAVIASAVQREAIQLCFSGSAFVKTTADHDDEWGCRSLWSRELVVGLDPTNPTIVQRRMDLDFYSTYDATHFAAGFALK